MIKDIDIPSWNFPGDSDGKDSACNVGDLGSVPWSRRSPGGGHDNPLQYCLENSMDRRAWQATVHGVTESWTCLRDLHFHFSFILRSPLCWSLLLPTPLLCFDPKLPVPHLQPMTSAHQRITVEATTQEEVKPHRMGGRGQRHTGTLRLGERMPERERVWGRLSGDWGVASPESLEGRAPPQTAQDCDSHTCSTQPFGLG